MKTRLAAAIAATLTLASCAGSAAGESSRPPESDEGALSGAIVQQFPDKF
jgi:hypothetical protein